MRRYFEVELGHGVRQDFTRAEDLRRVELPLLHLLHVARGMAQQVEADLGRLRHGLAAIIDAITAVYTAHHPLGQQARLAPIPFLNRLAHHGRSTPSLTDRETVVISIAFVVGITRGAECGARVSGSGAVCGTTRHCWHLMMTRQESGRG